MLDIGSRREMVVNMGERRRNVPRSMTRHILLGILYLGNDTPAFTEVPFLETSRTLYFLLLRAEVLGNWGANRSPIGY